MTDWRPARSLLVLRKQLDQLYPDRPRDCDGLVGDASHQARVSDHNPNAAGVVTAWDISTADFTDSLAEVLRSLGRWGDGRVKYVIYKHRIASAEQDWQWRVYNGLDPHTSHIHLSVSADPAQYDRDDPWPVEAITTTPKESDDVTPDEHKAIVETRKIAAAVDHRVDLLSDKVDRILEMLHDEQTEKTQ